MNKSKGMKLKSRLETIIIVIISLLILSYLIRPYIMFFLDPVFIHVYHYESTDRGFQDFEIPEKGRSLENVEEYFEKYKKQTGKKDVELRITDINEKKNIAEWIDSFNRRWKYKYMAPSKDMGSSYSE